MNTQVKMGIHRHYKGPLYQVLGTAHDANDPDRTAVVYFGLELNGAHLGPRLAVRTVEDFNGYVHPDDGSACENGHCVRSRERFLFLGQELEAWMIEGEK